MIISISQPGYIPWLGYFDRIAKSDIHIVLDHVQYEKNSMVPRNKIRTPEGWNWITVPLRTKGKFGQLAIRDLQINQQVPWEKKHWKTLEANYARSPFFDVYRSFFYELYQTRWTNFLPLVARINAYLLETLGIETRFMFSSELDPQKRKGELVLELCQKVGATTYISGPFGRDYLDFSAFNEAGIKVVFHDYPHPKYCQTFDGFEPYMSIVDLLFNYGPKSINILESPIRSLNKE